MMAGINSGQRVDNCQWVLIAIIAIRVIGKEIAARMEAKETYFQIIRTVSQIKIAIAAQIV